MKKIDLDEHKKIMIEMLNHIDYVCRQNKINYSLTAGSLIGAIRHDGFIPWDDDIDIILTEEEYKKLIDALAVDEKYTLLTPLNSRGYYYPYAKLVDNNTILRERYSKEIPDYGVYVDIFQYRYISNNRFIRYFSYKKQFFLREMLGLSAINNLRISNESNFVKKLLLKIIKKTDTHKWLKRYLKCLKKPKSNYVVNSWPIYGVAKDILLASDTRGYERHKFEGVDAMIFSKYDKILRTTFGDYMQLPPKEERKTHHDMEAYWKDGKK